jgi:ATP-binding cassette subfamily C protein
VNDNLRPAHVGLRGFVGALARERPGRFAWMIGLQAVVGLSQALRVLLLIPLLGAVGIGGVGGSARWIREVFATVGLRPTLATVLAIYVAVTGAVAALTVYQTVLTTRYRLEFVDHLRLRLYRAIAQAEWRQLLTLRHSDLLAVLTANSAWVGVGVQALLSGAAGGLVVLAQLMASLGISPPLTGLAIVTAAGLILVVWPLVRRGRRLGRELIERNRHVVGLTTGFLDALKLVKAFGREEQHVETFNDAITQSRGSQIEFARASALASAVQTTLTAALLALTVYAAVRSLHVPISSLLVVTFVFSRVVSQATGLQTNVEQVAQTLPAFTEVMTSIAICEGVAEAPGAIGPSSTRIRIGQGVRLNAVHFTYPEQEGEGSEAVGGVSMALRPGSLVALAGPSGAGKSTVADLAAGLIMPSAGEVTIDGRRLTVDRMQAWRRSVALVPQDPFLFYDTIRANLCWAKPGAAEDELWRALRLAAADGFVGARPSGLDTVVGDRGMRLSGGERQRLALARALLREPDLLILDEATNALDMETERTIRDALAAIRGQTTILMISHRPSTLSWADDIVVLDSGRVVEAGSWAKLSHNPPAGLRSLPEMDLPAQAPEPADGS